MDLKAVEENADTMPLQTIDNLFRVWQHDESDVETVTNILRCLRAALALNARGEVRGHIAGKHGEALFCFAWGILVGSTSDSEPVLARKRCLLQVLISTCACSPTFLELLKQDDKHPSTFQLAVDCVNEEDTKLRLYGVMLAKVCLEKDPYMLRYPSLLLDLLYTFVESEGDERVAAEALAALHIAIEHNVAETVKHIWEHEHISEKLKCALLDILHEIPSDSDLLDPSAAPSVVASLFKKQSTALLTTFRSKDVAEADPAVTIKLLDILCAWTTSEDGSEIREAVQSDTSLLIDAVYLLRMIHELGSEVEALKPVKKLSELDEAAVAANPVFGFKRDLVRLVGNMCWRHRKNQDTVRDIDGIPLLLDCSPIDANNPIMPQWVIFALRNLCDGNEDNQGVIASIDKKGVAADELGIKMRAKEN